MRYKIVWRRKRKKRSSAQYVQYKAAALEFAKRKIAEFNVLYGFNVNRISIKNQKSRWGSCSKKGNLNFNYRIALLPEHQGEYVVLHELCHLGEFNHSKRFWNLVAKAMPDYQKTRHEFKHISIY